MLARLQLNRGDLWVLAGLLIYALYCVTLRRRPAVHPLSFLVVAMGIGSLMMLPFMLREYAAGARIHGGLPSYLGIAYTAVLPSLVAYLFFIRGGPGGQRAQPVHKLVNTEIDHAAGSRAIFQLCGIFYDRGVVIGLLAGIVIGWAAAVLFEHRRAESLTKRVEEKAQEREWI